MKRLFSLMGFILNIIPKAQKHGSKKGLNNTSQPILDDSGLILTEPIIPTIRMLLLEKTLALMPSQLSNFLNKYKTNTQLKSGSML